MNWRLMFSGAQSTGWMLSVILLVTTAAVLCLWLLRLERQLVTTRVAHTLTALRLLLFVLLLLTFLQPVLTRSTSADQVRRLIVAVDVSQSMETKDRHAAASESLRWAQALGMIGNEKQSAFLDQWAGALDEGKEPDWTGTGKPPADESERDLAAGRQRQLEQIRQEFSGMSRREFAGRLLTESSTPLLSRLSKIAPVDLRLFAADSFSVTQAQLEKILLPSSTGMATDNGNETPGMESKVESESLSNLTTGRRETDFGPLLRSVMNEQTGSETAAGKPPRGVILLTDGRQTVSSGSSLTGADLISETQRLKSLGIPVFCIPIGSRLAPRDLVIASVELPETVYLNDQAEVSVLMGTSGFEGNEIVARLMLGDAVIEEKKYTPSDDQSTVKFRIPAEKAGRFQYSVVTPSLPGELSEENNRREFTLQVTDNKAQVLLVENDPRWEFRYLKNLLERDPRVELSSVLFNQPWMQLLNDTFIPRTLPAAQELAEILAETEVMILGDLPPDQLTDDLLAVIEKAVSTDGLTLLVIPGKEHLPHRFQSDLLNSLLPVTDTNQRRADQFVKSNPDEEQSAWHLELTDEAKQLSVFRLDETEPRAAVLGMLGAATAGGDDAIREEYLNLPGHPWIYSATPRASSTAWAMSYLKGNTAPPEAVILHHYYGAGQVIWIGMDSTWRWRRRAGDQFHHRFWGQLIRWGARNKASRGNGDVTLSLSDVTIDDTESVDVMTRWRESALQQLKDGQVEAVLKRSNDGTGMQSIPQEGEASRDGEAPAEPLSPDTSALPSAQQEPRPPGRPPEEVIGQSSLVGKTPSTDSESKTVAEERVIRLKADPSHPERYTARVTGLPPGSWHVTLRTQGTALQIPEEVRAELEVRPRPSAELANVSCHRDLLQQLAAQTGGAVIEPSETEKLLPLVQLTEEESLNRMEERTLWDHWSVLIVFFSVLSAEWVVRKLNGLP